jgi:hypothetical protein
MILPEKIELKYVKKPFQWDSCTLLKAYFAALLIDPSCDSCGASFPDEGRGYLDDLGGFLTQCKRKVKDIRLIRTRQMRLGNAILRCYDCMGKTEGRLHHRVVVKNLI